MKFVDGVEGAGRWVSPCAAVGRATIADGRAQGIAWEACGEVHPERGDGSAVLTIYDACRDGDAR
jgi:hypothetical protein